MSLPDSFKICLTSVNLFLPKFFAKVIHPLLIWVSETFNGKLRPDALLNGTVADPLWPPLPTKEERERGD